LVRLLHRLQGRLRILGLNIHPPSTIVAANGRQVTGRSSLHPRPASLLPPLLLLLLSERLLPSFSTCDSGCGVARA
jgi:hypothetical protein